MERIYKEEKHGTSTVGPCMVSAIDVTGRCTTLQEGVCNQLRMPVKRGSKGSVWLRYGEVYSFI